MDSVSHKRLTTRKPRRREKGALAPRSAVAEARQIAPTEKADTVKNLPVRIAEIEIDRRRHQHGHGKIKPRHGSDVDRGSNRLAVQSRYPLTP